MMILLLLAIGLGLIGLSSAQLAWSACARNK
jgi:hypothetical protein